MGNLLDRCEELMTKEEVAKILRIRVSMVHRIGLKKTRIGKGRGVIRYRIEDVNEYIFSRVEREEVMKGAGQQKERYRKMGVSPLLSWEELQKARLGHAGGGG
jgi:hypothetical protein